MNKIKVYYPDEKIKRGEKSIFLAGTTSDGPKGDWRKKVIKLLEKKGYDGVVYNPDYSSLKVKNDYRTQLEWELRGVRESTVTMFWIDRDLARHPGLTTNVEFGYWLRAGNVVYGRPDSSEKCLYLDMLYDMELGKKPSNNLEDLVDETLAFLNS